jgi:Ca-activated chloride channel family protein
MSAGRPLELLFLLVLVPVTIAALVNYRRGKISRQLLTGEADGGVFFARSFFGGVFFCGFIVCCVLALADISWGKRPVREDTGGLDIMLALDVSRSMLAQDARPNRLAAAAEIAQGLLQGLSRARFGAVVFKGGAVRAVPLTEDRQALETFLDSLSPAMVQTPGSSVEAGIEEALRSFPGGTSGAGRAIVLLSDGESLPGVGGNAAAKAGALGVPVFAVGMGGGAGTIIRLSGGEILRGRDGANVVTRLNPGALKNTAENSGGAYFSGEDPGTLASLLDSLREFEDSRARMGFRLAPAPRYRDFLLAGFGLLCASVLARSAKLKRFKGKK